MKEQISPLWKNIQKTFIVYNHSFSFATLLTSDLAENIHTALLGACGVRHDSWTRSQLTMDVRHTLHAKPLGLSKM
jgi:hypothetical protein